MMTMQTVLDRLAGTEIFDALIEAMEEMFPDFADARRRYENAMEALSKNAAAKEAAEAIRRQTASNLFFSGVLGIRANLDRFIDPVRRDFLDAEPECYLREETARRLPEYAQAQETLDRFFASLSPDHREYCDDITAYICYLETAGPKLAHYYGYLLGNALLPRAVPGYHPDPVQTARYRMTLGEYLGCRLPEA